MANLDPQLKVIIDSITAGTGKRSDLNTTDKTTLVAAINEIKTAQDALGTVEHTAADITARDALTGLIVGDRVFVTDASADATVDAGWAVYRVQTTAPTFLKMAEQESLDVAIVANLSAGTVDGTTYEVAIDTGTNITLPGANATEAGLMIAADKVRHDDIAAQVATVEAEDYATYVNTKI